MRKLRLEKQIRMEKEIGRKVKVSFPSQGPQVLVFLVDDLDSKYFVNTDTWEWEGWAASKTSPYFGRGPMRIGKWQILKREVQG